MTDSEKKGSESKVLTDAERFEKFPYSKRAVEQQLGTILLALNALEKSSEDMDIKVQWRRPNVAAFAESDLYIVFTVSKSDSITLKYIKDENSWHIESTTSGNAETKHPFQSEDKEQKYEDMERVLSYLQSTIQFANPENNDWKKIGQTWNKKLQSARNRNDAFDEGHSDIETADQKGVNPEAIKRAMAEAAKLLAEYEKRKGMTEMPKQFDLGNIVRRKASDIGEAIRIKVQQILPKRKPAQATKTDHRDTSGFGDTAAADNFLNDFTGSSESLSGWPTSKSDENKRPSEFELEADDEPDELPPNKLTGRSDANQNHSEFVVEDDPDDTDEDIDFFNPSNARTQSSSFDDMVGFGETRNDPKVADDFWSAAPTKRSALEDPSIFEDKASNHSATKLLEHADYKLDFIDYLKTEAGITEYSFRSDHADDFAAVLAREVEKSYRNGRNTVQRFTTALFGQKESAMQKTKKLVLRGLLKSVGVDVPSKRESSKDESDDFFG